MEFIRLVERFLQLPPVQRVGTVLLDGHFVIREPCPADGGGGSNTPTVVAVGVLSYYDFKLEAGQHIRPISVSDGIL